MGALNVWRHPRTRAAAGCCLGRTDAPVDPRKSKRLAHRIRAWARRHRLPRVVCTSPLQRGADVGRWLARWGWCHQVDARLAELDFGAWDGRPWAEIARADIDAWCADFVAHRPGGGESVGALLARCAQFVGEAPNACVVGHAGWIGAVMWWGQGGGKPPDAASWPHAVAHGCRVEISAWSSPAAPAS